jgi:hypothetical protein
LLQPGLSVHRGAAEHGGAVLQQPAPHGRDRHVAGGSDQQRGQRRAAPQQQTRVPVDLVGQLGGKRAAALDEHADAGPAEGSQRHGDLEAVGPAGGADGAAEQVGQAGLGVVGGVEVVRADVQRGDLLPGREHAGGDGLPTELV